MAADSYKDLVIWQEAMDMSVAVFDLTSKLPRTETWLASQLKRAASSAPANIAEGFIRTTTKDFAHFLIVAKGSLVEVETFLVLATRAHYLSEEFTTPVLAQVEEVSRLVTVFRSRMLRRREE
jgi:four helix bundle protein